MWVRSDSEQLLVRVFNANSNPQRQIYRRCRWKEKIPASPLTCSAPNVISTLASHQKNPLNFMAIPGPGLVGHWQIELDSESRASDLLVGPLPEGRLCCDICDTRSVCEQSGHTIYGPTRIYGPTGHAIEGTAQQALRSFYRSYRSRASALSVTTTGLQRPAGVWTSPPPPEPVRLL
jgi:hypothetical protein